MIKILEKSKREIKIFNELKPLNKKGEIEVIFLYGFLTISKSNLDKEQKAQKLIRLVQFLTIKRKSLGITGLFTTNLILNSLNERLKQYVTIFNNSQSNSIIGNTIFGAFYNSPLKKNIISDANIFDSITVSSMIADMKKNI
ncbi:hypothetical protein OBK12_13120 [Empedobacter falsenii]